MSAAAGGHPATKQPTDSCFCTKTLVCAQPQLWLCEGGGGHSLVHRGPQDCPTICGLGCQIQIYLCFGSTSRATTNQHYIRNSSISTGSRKMAWMAWPGLACNNIHALNLCRSVKLGFGL
jgi:hypothetical protein